MARPLTWDELQPGTEVWEERLLGYGDGWLPGYGTVHRTVLLRDGDRVWLIKDGVRTLAERPSPNHRFWDAEPTREERDRTPWRALYEQ